ncbi:MAG TPA: GWxTD domain-containing protein [Ignavibacteriaceae bacterium]|nr:GWxTD domain-containing protein [Ignavibacteriaceae bacterium]
MDSKNRFHLLALAFTALLFILQPYSTAQDSPVVSKGSLQFYLDHSSFQGKEGKTYAEFYLMLFSDQLIKDENDTAAVKEFIVKSIISDSLGINIVSDKQWTTNALLTRDSMNPEILVVYDQWAELMDPGVYNVKVMVSTEIPAGSGEADFILKIPSFKPGTFALSEIEFVSEVQDKKDNSPFIKGNRDIIPDPWRRYGALNSRLSFFYEVYNIPGEAELSGEYIIRDNTGKIIKKLSGIKINNSSDNISIVHGINVSGLPTGVYDLSVCVNDSLNNQSVSQTRSFEIIQMDTTVHKTTLTEEEAEIEGGLIKYVGTPSEYSLYKNLDLNGKSRYIIIFWAEKDPTPGTPENEFLQQVIKRFQYANQNFKWQSIEGWKSDRGRVIIKYGMPDETESHTSEAGTRSYDIWTYNKDKTYVFVFADLRSNGNYFLIHSTKEGEISDPNWREYIR